MTERSAGDGEERLLRSALESVDHEHPPSPEALAQMESAMIEAYLAERAGIGATGDETSVDDRIAVGVGTVGAGAAAVGSGGSGQRRWGRLSLVATCAALMVGSVVAFRTLASESNNSTTPAEPAPATIDAPTVDASTVDVSAIDAWCRQELSDLLATVPAAITENGFAEDVSITLDEFALVLRSTDRLPGVSVEQSSELRRELSDRLASVKTELILDNESETSRRAVADLLGDLGDTLVELGGSAEACTLVDR